MPVIPDSVVNMGHSFQYCYNIVNVSQLPPYPDNMQGCFAQCFNLTDVNFTPDSLMKLIDKNESFGAEILLKISKSLIFQK